MKKTLKVSRLTSLQEARRILKNGGTIYAESQEQLDEGLGGVINALALGAACFLGIFYGGRSQ